MGRDLLYIVALLIVAFIIVGFLIVQNQRAQHQLRKERDHQQELNVQRQRYLDGKITLEQYDEALKRQAILAERDNE